ncbi:aminotransferase class III-fold pyridoxal phosphate-dependent enzyme [Arcanobacterium ihumii]|uniref:aminotransferase class III-fold pyridoxal phosphate-dependent enzyme n=1 Tax=Arcanobacterium ihumii TaxID=2138162 RepID=UPI000F52EA32|nr:aminotransferase class III-fold pyridoxal phosphate-dependent enzyme [Arcanobacterium ihumii]
METYKYPKSSELFLRATKVIPGGVYGHLGPAEGCFMPVSNYPIYLDHAQGSYFWDLDGNKFIDYMCAYGPNILGYNDPDVNAAAMAQYKKGDCTILPTQKMVELAELLTDTVANADWAFFAKNGGDVTSLAVMTAKAATNRDKIVMHFGGYHGVAPWTQHADHPGVTKADVSNNLYTPFGDFSALKKVVYENRGEIAAIISTPYHHPIVEDNRMAPEGYWQKVRDLCKKEGILLIIDDVRCGFRLDVRGSDVHYGFDADLLCYCKALANGFNISALVGKKEYMDAVSSVFYTGSYWLSAVPMAAAIACIKKMREIDVAKVCTEKGIKLTGGLKEIASSHGFDLRITGEPSMWFMRTAGYRGEVDPNNFIHQAFVAECVKRGVFFANHHNLFINASLTDDDIQHTLDVADEAYRVVSKNAKQLLGKVM